MEGLIFGILPYVVPTEESPLCRLTSLLLVVRTPTVASKKNNYHFHPQIIVGPSMISKIKRSSFPVVAPAGFRPRGPKFPRAEKYHFFVVLVICEIFSI